MKILKFGGTSVGSTQRIKNVAGLVAQRGENLVVLSAMAGTTNTLADIAGCLYNHNQEAARQIISTLRDQYLAHVAELFPGKAQAGDFINQVFDSIKAVTGNLFTVADEKFILSRGEIISSQMLAWVLEDMGIKVKLLNALEFMRLAEDGEPDLEYIGTHLKPLLNGADLYITQGYICLNAQGEIDNLQRGGSDYTACLAGAAVGAEEIQIWTDIDGMHNNDPRYVDGTSAVRHLSFDEAAELAYFGAKILHPSCIQPARHAGIPVRLLNTLEPEAPGTIIDSRPDTGTIKAVAAKDKITAIKIKSSRMLLAHGFLRKVFEIFESYRTPIDMICTSEVGVSMSIDDTSYLGEIVHDLKKYGTVEVDLDMCIICVVGDMNWENLGFETAVLEAMKDIPVRMVSYGGSNYNISLLVREQDKVRALKALSSKLF
jgi:aspartate kinase